MPKLETLPEAPAAAPARPSGFLPFSAPWVAEEEIRELVSAVESGWLTAGPRTRRFEADFRDYAGVEHAVAVNSCTAALEVALRAIGIGPGDAVLTTPFTFAATANVIVHCGAEVVFADISPETYNLDPASVERMIGGHCRPAPEGGMVTRAGGNRLRAIIAVHYAGRCCAMEQLGALAERYGLAVIEDAAHAAGSRYRGRPAGSLATAGCFSFYPTKNMTTGEGGMLTTNDAEFAARARQLAHHGITRDGWGRYSADGGWRYDVEQAGYKYNMTDLAAALGIHQLRRLAGFVERRRHLAARYDQALGRCRGLVLPSDDPEGYHSRHLYPVQVVSGRVSRDRFIEELGRRGIGSSVHFIPLHLTSFYRRRCGFAPGDFPVAERIWERIVSLPLFPAMTEEQAERVIAATLEILEGEGER